MAAEELLKEIKRIVKETPFADAVSDIDFEGPKVVFYCKNLDLLMENGEAIKELARKIRKRIILRPDPSILTEKEKAEQQIRKLVPEEAGITDIIFSEDIGEVTIEAEKPGIAIGKGGTLLRELMYKINWTPRVVRAPPIKSEIVKNIRLSMIHAGSERREILRKIGRRIHREQKAKGDWVRFTALGGAREVGRSSFLLQTPESKVMIDCGVNVASEDRAYPHLEAPEVRLSELDAVVISHSHLDHCGFVPYLFKYGFEGPVYCTPATRDLAVLLQMDYVEIAEREDKPIPYNKRDISTFLSHCIPLDYGDVTDITPDVRVTLHNAGHILGCVTPDTYVVLGDGSIRQIGEVVGNPSPHSVEALAADFNVMNFKPASAQAWGKRWNGPIFHVGTTSGYEVRVTPEHPFFVIRDGQVQSVRADQLRSNDYVAVLGQLPVCGRQQRLNMDFQRGKKWNARSIKAPKKTSSELCQLLGYLLGGGAIIWNPDGRTARLQLTDENADNLRLYGSRISKLFGLSCEQLHRSNRSRGVELVINCTELVRFLEANFPGLLARSPSRSLPTILTAVSDREVAGLLRGLFDAEGCVTRDFIQLSMSSRDVVQKVRLLLLRYGIQSSYRCRTQSQRPRGNKPIHVLTITDRDSRRRFARYIKFGDTRKAKKLQAALRMPKHPRRWGGYHASIPGVGTIIKDVRTRLFLKRADIDITVKHYECGRHPINSHALAELADRFLERLAELRQLRSKCIDDHEGVRQALGLSYRALGRMAGLRAGQVYFALKSTKRGGHRSGEYRKRISACLEKLLAEERLAPLEENVKRLVRMAALEVRWDRVKVLKKERSNGIGYVCDLTVPTYHNFITNGIVSHNSSVLHFHIGEGLHNIVYTGDIKFDRTRLFSPAVYTFPRVETLIIESTYGGAEDIQPHRTEAEKEFVRIVMETVKRGGKVLIPAFAVGRSQEIMVLLEDFKRKGALDNVPVYLDGMIWEATAIHTAYPEYLSQDLRELIFKADENPFLSDMFVKVSGPDQRANVIDGEPGVIISTAGMMTGGPVMEYFKHLAPDPRNTLVFVGYQAEGSLGRRIQKGWREIPLAGEKGKVEEVKVNLDIKTIEGFSGHSDRAQLLNYVRRISPKPQRILSIHGDENKCIDLSSAMHKLFRVETRAMQNLETVRLR